MSNIAVFGIYPNTPAAEEAVGTLKAEGFRGADVSILVPENVGTKDLGVKKNTKAPEGVTTGVIMGGVICGILGGLIGSGLLVISGVEPLIAAGTVIAVLTGIGVGCVIGGIIGAIAGFTRPEYEAKRYEGRVKNGGILLSVHADDAHWSKRAKEILERTGAEDIAATSESRGDFANSKRPATRTLPSDTSTLPIEEAHAREEVPPPVSNLRP